MNERPRNEILTLLASGFAVGALAGAAIKRMRGEAEPGFRVQRTVTILRHPDEVASALREPHALSRYFPVINEHMELAAQPTSAGNATVAWMTTKGIPHRLAVMLRPAPGDRGTEARLVLDIAAPGPRGTLGRVLGAVPAKILKESLHHLRAQLETGESITNGAQSGAAQPAGVAATA